MILYKAVCSNHNYESRLYASKTYAKGAAARHRNNVDGRHDLEIIQIFVPNDAIQVQSVTKFK